MRTDQRLRLIAFFTVIVTLIIFFDCATAYIPCYCNNPPDQCTCFIQLGDIGFSVKQIIKVLQEQGYLGKLKRQDAFTAEVRDAVIAFQTEHDLECTGWMDDETLDELLTDILPDDSVQYTEEQWWDIVFVPTDGGKRYHLNPTCCKMYNPRLISRTNAERLGIKRCGLESDRSTSTLGQTVSTRALGMYYSANALSAYAALDLRPRVLPDKYYTVDEKVERSLPSDDAEVVYIGNKNTHVFHRENCGSVKTMSEQSKVFFLTREEAKVQDYEPCGRCKP